MFRLFFLACFRAGASSVSETTAQISALILPSVAASIMALRLVPVPVLEIKKWQSSFRKVLLAA